MSESPPITIVLSDDHRMVRSGLRLLLGSDPRMEVVAESGDVVSTVDAVRERRPSVLVLDLNLGGESGLDAIPDVHEVAPETAIVILTMQEDPSFARAALDAGALGYVLKDAADEELIEAVAMAARGERHVASSIATAITQPTGDRDEDDGLTPREREVLTLIALGNTNPEIAATLGLSVRTVESHRAHIHQKIDAPTRADLVAHARRRGLVD